MNRYKVYANITQKGETYITAKTLQEAYELADELEEDDFTIVSSEIDVNEVSE